MTYDSKLDTLKHKKRVLELISKVNTDLMFRGLTHDDSKLEEPEKSKFDEYTPKLKNLEYGSKEYKEALKGLDNALVHHYEMNDHHPEHFENGIKDMDLISLIELICDWIASSERHDNGDPIKSIDINQERFGYSDDLKEILKNTVERLK